MRLGADPEVFLKDHTGKHLSVIGKIGANKWNPRQIPDMPDGFTLQEDNVALEFGVPPAANADEFVRNIRSVMRAGLSNLPGTRFSKLSCTVFPADQMTQPEAYIFGCEPDFNAWTGEANEKPEPPHKHMRSAGGHVHIETQLDPKAVIRACDLFLGVPSVLIDNGEDRRKLYGKAGAYRPKPYGAEYRTLSNFWIFRPKYIKWVWRNVERALDFVQNEHLNLNGSIGKVIQQCINTGDKKLAQHLVNEFSLEIV